MTLQLIKMTDFLQLIVILLYMIRLRKFPGPFHTFVIFSSTWWAKLNLGVNQRVHVFLWLKHSLNNEFKLKIIKNWQGNTD